MDVVAPADTPDPVSDALRALNVRSTVFCLSELGAPWAFRVDGARVAKFHLVLTGRGWLSIDGREPTSIEAGDLILLPHGHAHTIADAPDSPATALDDLLAEHPPDERGRMRCGGEGAQTQLLCGGFALAESGAEPMLELLPDVVRLEGGSMAGTAWLAPLLGVLQSEAGAGNPGSGAVLAKIADVCLTQALRIWLVGAERVGIMLAGPLQDEVIGKALRAIRERPTDPWTIGLLARHVGLSRTAFATRFRALVGESPMRYVTKTRLSLAAGYLATSRRSTYEIARLSGYDNESSLSRAFRREFGQPPGRYRAAARLRPSVTVTPA
jgi:AraC-like DNA-binding protein/mannose-6-phosphate isomerase-like protein (cupin superfamily)